MKVHGVSSVLIIVLLMGAIVPMALPAGATTIDTTASGASGLDIIFPDNGGSKNAGDYKIPYNAYLLDALLTLEEKAGPFNSSILWKGKTEFMKGSMSNISSVSGSLVLDKFFKNWTSPEGWSGAELKNLSVENKMALIMKLSGTYFIPNVQLPMNGMGGADQCDIAIDMDGNIHVIFASTPQTPQLNYYRSSDGGKTWDEIKTFSANGIVTPHIYIGPNGYIHILFNNILMGGGSLIYQRSTDNGTTFEAMKWTFTPQNVRVAFGADGVMHFVGFESQSYPPFETKVYYWNSTDNGTTQNPAVQVSDDPGNSSYKEGMNIAIDSANKVHIIWLDYRDSVNWDDAEIFYSSSVDHVTFRANMPIEASTMVYYGFPEMVIDSDDVLHIVWADNRTGDMDIYYTNSTDSGKTYSPSRAINTVIDGEQNNPSIALGPNGEIHVVWADGIDTTGGDIAYSTSNDHGMTFTDQYIVNDQVQPSQQLPRIAVDRNNIPNVIWWDDRSAMEVYFTKTFTPYATEGELTGVADLGLEPAELAHVVVMANKTAGTDVLLSIRTSHDNSSWSQWETCLLDDNYFQGPIGRYVNWRIVLISSDGFSTPSVTSMRIERSEYRSEGQWVSDMVSTEHGIKDVTVTWNSVESDLLKVLVSNDNGTTWNDADIGQKVIFPLENDQMKVKVIFSSPGNRTPGLTEIKVNYSSSVFPTDLRLELGTEGTLVWNKTGELDTVVQVNFTKALDAYLKAYQGGLDPVPVSLQLISKSAGMVRVSNISIIIDQPPVIESWEPEATTPSIDEGGNISFKVVAKDPDGMALTYKWFLNGAEVKGTIGPELQYTASTVGKGTYQIQVIVSDGRFMVNRSWTLQVVDLDWPPIIDSVDPALWSIEFVKGVVATFKVVAHDPDGDPLAYYWYLDEMVIQGASGANWTLNYNITTIGKVLKLKVVVDDGTNSVNRTWNLTIRSVAKPKIDDWTPKGTINTTKGKSIDMSILASHPDGLALNYTWYINGQKVQGASSKNYLFESGKTGTYTVKVVVSDGNNNADHEWTVVVKKKETKDTSVSFLVGGVLALVLVIAGVTATVYLLRRKGGAKKTDK